MADFRHDKINEKKIYHNKNPTTLAGALVDTIAKEKTVIDLEKNFICTGACLVDCFLSCRQATGAYMLAFLLDCFGQKSTLTRNE